MRADVPSTNNYFESDPITRRLTDHDFDKAATTTGRFCIELVLACSTGMMLVTRKSPPWAGPWLLGNGFQLSPDFRGLAELGQTILRQEIGLSFETSQFQNLKPRFYCLSERTYNEAIFMLAVRTSAEVIKEAKTLSGKYAARPIFVESRDQLDGLASQMSGMMQHQASKDLWDELVDCQLIR